MGAMCSSDASEEQLDRTSPLRPSASGDEILPVNSPHATSTALKLIILGDVSVGKTSLCSRFIRDSFSAAHVSTIGAAFATMEIDLDPPVQIAMWDTAGEERFRAMTKFYFRRTDVAVAVFDVSQPDSLANVDGWVADLRAESPKAKIILAGNKMDLVDPKSGIVQQGEQVCERLELSAFRVVSAKNGNGVQELFKQAALIGKASRQSATT